MSITITVVAAGAMGAAIGGRLASRGARVLTALAQRSDATIARARAAGMQDAAPDALAAADLILSIVPPDQALPLADWFAAQIERVGSTPLYVDLNATNAATARDVAHRLAGCGTRFVDGSIIGGPPRGQDAGPTLYLAGPDAPAASHLLGEHGLVVKCLAGEIGAASALKMSYAGLTKGFTALGAAMILAAYREDAADALAAELASSQPEMLARLRRGIPDMLPKAYRWVPEMQEIAGFIGPDDPASAIYQAIAHLYQQIADDHDQHGPLQQTLQAFFQTPSASPAPEAAPIPAQPEKRRSTG